MQRFLPNKSWKHLHLYSLGYFTSRPYNSFNPSLPVSSALLLSTSPSFYTFVRHLRLHPVGYLDYIPKGLIRFVGLLFFPWPGLKDISKDRSKSLKTEHPQFMRPRLRLCFAVPIHMFHATLCKFVSTEVHSQVGRNSSSR